jgi:hypothetical protein
MDVKKYLDFLKKNNNNINYLTKNISDIAGNKFILVYYIDENNKDIPVKYILNIK